MPRRILKYLEELNDLHKLTIGRILELIKKVKLIKFIQV